MKDFENVSVLISEIFEKLKHFTEVIDDITVKIRKLDELIERSQGPTVSKPIENPENNIIIDLTAIANRKRKNNKKNEQLDFDDIKLEEDSDDERSQGPTVFQIAEEEIRKIIKTDDSWFYRGYTFKLKDGMPYDERFGGYLSDEDVVYAVDDEINKLNDIYDDVE